VPVRCPAEDDKIVTRHVLIAVIGLFSVKLNDFNYLKSEITKLTHSTFWNRVRWTE